jgi:hypothetical protein
MLIAKDKKAPMNVHICSPLEIAQEVVLATQAASTCAEEQLCSRT